jgi:MFS family permease
MERSIWAVTAATFTLRFATGLTGALLIFFLADLADHGGREVGPFVIGLFTALFFAAELILSPPFGLLSDRIGTHRVMQIGPVIGFVAVLLTALTAEIRASGSVIIALPLLVGSLPVIGFTRILEGASTAASVPSVLSFIALATSGDEALRGRASARFEAATIGGLVLGFALAGPVWTVLGPAGFVANALVYTAAFAVFRYSVPRLGASLLAPAPPRQSWRRYRRLLRRSRVWLLAPTWIAMNAVLGLYTSQALFQLIRSRDERFANQALVGGFGALEVTAAFLIGGAVFFVGLWYWGGRFDALRRTTIIFYGIVGGSIFVVAALLVNHTGGADVLVRLPALLGLGVGLFLMAGATPAALGLLADISESFPQDRGAVMGLYSVFLALGQIVGALVGAVAAELWAFDGILLATLALMAVELMPLSRLRRFEFRFQATPQSEPDLDAVAVDLAVTRAHRLDVRDKSGGG